MLLIKNLLPGRTMKKSLDTVRKSLTLKELRRRVGQISREKAPEPAALKVARRKVATGSDPFVHPCAAAIAHRETYRKALQRFPSRESGKIEIAQNFHSSS